MEHLQDGLAFVGIIATVLFLIILWKIPNLKVWWNEQDGRGAVASALLGILIILAVGVGGALLFNRPAHAESILDTQYGRFFNNAYVYAGVDHTFKTSAQCEPGASYADDRLTSNMGFGTNVWRSNSGRVLLDFIYHHQSCVIGSDRNSYDAVGIQAKWLFWER